MMRLPDPNALAAILSRRFGVAFGVEHAEGADGVYLDFSPKDLHDNEGFSIRTTIGWRSVLATLRIGKFGADLIREFAQSSKSQRSIFACMARTLADEGGEIQLRINRVSADPFLPDTWTEHWTRLELSVERTPLMLDHNNETNLRETVLFWGGGTLGMVLALLPVEEIDSLDAGHPEGLPEGAVQRVDSQPI